MSTIIEDAIARKVFNSRGEETVEVDIITTSGFGRVAAPAGKSRGKGRGCLLSAGRSGTSSKKG